MLPRLLPTTGARTAFFSLLMMMRNEDDEDDAMEVHVVWDCMTGP